MRFNRNDKDPVPLSVAVLLILLYSFGVLGHDLWTPDEPRVAAVARQVAEGAWVVPTLNGSPFLEQPPLYYWCVAAVYRTFGYEPPEIGRVVSAVFGIGGLVLVYLIAAHIARGKGEGASRRVGALAALSLGLSLEYLSTAHRVVVDGALAFFTTAAAYAFLQGFSSERRGAALAFFAGGYSFASLAFLAKGPIGLAVSGLALLAIVFAHREPRRVLKTRLWLAPLCFLAVAGPWLYFLYRETGLDGFREIFIRNTLGRSLPIPGAERAHVRPLYFYFLYLPLHLLPATLFTLGGALRRFRGRSSLDPCERFAHDFSLAWLGGGFLLLSLAMTKRAIYLVPFFPAAAVAGGFWLEAFLEKRADGLYDRTIGYVLAILLAVLAVASPCAAVFLGGKALWAIAGAVAGVAAAAAAWIALRRKKRGRALFLWAAGLSVTLLAALHSIVPAVDASKSLRTVSVRVASIVPPDRPIHALNPDETTEGMIPFYTGRPLVAVATLTELESLLSNLGEVYLLTVDKSRYAPESPEWKTTSFGSVEHLPHELVLEDPGGNLGSRVIRLLRIWKAER